MSALRTMILMELRQLFFATSTYWAAVFFLGFMGSVYHGILQDYAKIEQESSPITQFFQLFWIPVFFVVPLITMRSIADERRQGTLVATLTTHANAWTLVFAKFCGAYSLYCFLWGLTATFHLIVYYFIPEAKLLTQSSLFDTGALTGGYLFVAISGILFVAIGIFTSSLTRSQLVAGMLCFTLLFIVLVGAKLTEQIDFSELIGLSWLQQPVIFLKTHHYLEIFSRGLWDSRPLIFYITNGFLFLGIASLVVESKK